LSRTVPPFARDDLVAVAGIADDDRLHHSLALDRLGKRFDRVRVKDGARLSRVRTDLRHLQLHQRDLAGGELGNERGEAPAQSPILSHARRPPELPDSTHPPPRTWNRTV